MKTEVKAEIPTTALFLRPHHFLREHVQKALICSEKPNKLARSITVNRKIQRKVSNDPSGYYLDVLGISHQDEQKYRERYEHFLNRIFILPDSAFVQLDLTPDGICASCALGKHCSGTNYQSRYCLVDTANFEKQCISQIENMLNYSGFRLGTDFFIVQTIHTLFDFRGQKLGSSIDPIRVNIAFNALVTQAGVLRKVIKDEEECKLLLD